MSVGMLVREPRHGCWLRAVIVGAGAIMLAIGVLLPVYSDEIGWRFQERAWIDGVDKAYGDLCGVNTLARPPWFMLPVRWFSATANQAFADPLFVRLEGLICAFAWAALAWLLIARLELDPRRRIGLQTLAAALIGMGTLPFLMVMSRPEQPLLLTLTLMLLVALMRPAGAAITTAKVAAIVVLGTIAASYHMKGIAYAPIALTCLLVCARGRCTIAPRLVGAVAFVAMAATAASYWVRRFQCPDDPALAHKLSGENLASTLAGGASPVMVVRELLKGADPVGYVRLAAPSNNPMSSWIPVNLFPGALPAIFRDAMTYLWTAAVLLALTHLVRFVAREKLRFLGEARAVLAVATFACLMVWGMSQVNRNVYEAAHVLPLLMVFVMLCLTLPLPSCRWLDLVRGALIPVTCGATLVSQATVIAFTIVPLLEAAGTPGYLPRQEFSVSIAGYDTVRGDMARAMAGAGFDPRVQQHGLLVDDVTYLALQRHRLPFHRLGVLAVWNADLTDPVAYLIAHDSAGIVLPCPSLPPGMLAAAHRSGGICAISRDGLRQLSEGQH